MNEDAGLECICGKGLERELLIKKWGHEVEERPPWPRCVQG